MRSNTLTRVSNNPGAVHKFGSFEHPIPFGEFERAREEARDRVLSPAELAKLAAALNDFEDRYPASVAAIRTAALTGLRIREACWRSDVEHVDFETGRLTLPETKTGRRQHDLPTAALEILFGFHRINDGPSRPEATRP